MTRMRMRCTAMTIVLLAAGCSDPFGADEPDLALSFRGEAGHLDRLSALVIDVGGRDFRLEPHPAPAPAMNVNAPREGTLRVQVAVLDSAEQTIGSADFERRFSDDSRHWISGLVGFERPVGICIGQVLAVPLVPASPGAVPDTLFLMHGSITKGAIC